MPRVMFTISYGVKPEMRDTYLSLIAQLKTRFRAKAANDYSVFEAKGKRNTFTEIFVTESLEEFETLEDNQDEATQGLVEKLEECMERGGRKYSTLVEIE